MIAPYEANLELASEAATIAFAHRLGESLTPGDTVLLSGEIGSGKTFLARALIQHLMGNHVEDVPSPTFTLVQTYTVPIGEIWHADLYRLADSWDLVELGLEDALGRAICLIEWPDRMGDMKPDDALSITLEATEMDTARIAKLETRSPKWQSLLEGEHR